MLLVVRVRVCVFVRAFVCVFVCVCLRMCQQHTECEAHVNSALELTRLVESTCHTTRMEAESTHLDAATAVAAIAKTL